MSNGEVRAAREAAGLNQTEVARAVGISQATLSYYELYHVPLPRHVTPSDVIDAIARLRAQSTEPQTS